MPGNEATERILRRGTKFFATAVAGHLLAARNGSDFAAQIDIARLSDKAMQERLQKYAFIAVTYYVNAMRDLISKGGHFALLIRNNDTTEKVLSQVQERLVEEELTAPKTLEKLPKLPRARKR